MTRRELQLLEHLVAEVRALHVKADRLDVIEATLERLAPPPKSATPRDYRVLVRLLPALAVTFDDAGFQASDIAEIETLRTIVSMVTAGKERPTQVIGQFLKRCTGVRVKGRWLQFEGEPRGISVFSVREVRLTLPIAAMDAA